MNRGDPITVALGRGERLQHGLVLGVGHLGSAYFVWATSLNVAAPVFQLALADESIYWCRGHLSRKDAEPLMVAAGLAWEPR